MRSMRKITQPRSERSGIIFDPQPINCKMKHFVVLLSVASVFATEWLLGGRAWWSHIEFLASDALEGRRAGSPGHTKAAQHVAAKFREAGLKAQANPRLYPTRADGICGTHEPASSLELIKDGQKPEGAIGGGTNLGVRIDRPGEVEADVVFVGHALTIPQANINDLDGVDLKGKIAMYLAGAPTSLSPPLAAHAQSIAGALEEFEGGRRDRINRFCRSEIFRYSMVAVYVLG